MLKFLLLSVALFAVLTKSTWSSLEDQTYVEPIRDIAIVAAQEAFYPEKIIVFKNENVRFFLTTTVTGGGKSCFFLDKTAVQVPLTLGEIKEVQMVFKDAGTYPYFCPTNKIKGSIIVARRPDEIAKEGEIRRKASFETWRPRDDTDMLKE